MLLKQEPYATEDVPQRVLAEPDWATYSPNSIWIYDSTHFTRCGMAVLIIEDLVSRKWLTHVVSAQETHTQVRLGFEQPWTPRACSRPPWTAPTPAAGPWAWTGRTS